MNAAVPGIRYRHPSLSRDEDDGVRTCHGSFIANRYGSTASFQDDYLFGLWCLWKGMIAPGFKISIPTEESLAFPFSLSISIEPQFIWLAVGRTLKTRDLAKFN